MKSNILGIIVFALVILMFKTVFIISEGEQVIITEFGKPVGKAYTNAGVQVKTPWQTVLKVDKRILHWDGDVNQIPTKDKKYIRVDTTARWQVIDALKFIQTVQNEQGAKPRLDTILDGYTRDVISNHNLVEAVRNSNNIIESIKMQRALIEEKKSKGEFVLEEEISGEIEAIKVGREQLSQLIVKGAEKELKALGIKLIDVQFRRISYEKSVEQKVYERMISERERVAQKIRSIGKGEKAKIEGRLQKDLQGIESKAYRLAQGIKGKAEAKATAIYAKALSSDAKFYEFVRTMEAYKKSISPNTKFLLSSDSQFFKFFK